MVAVPDHGRCVLTSGTLLTAPTTVVVSHSATTAPTAYSTTDVLLLVFSHCGGQQRVSVEPLHLMQCIQKGRNNAVLARCLWQCN